MKPRQFAAIALALFAAFAIAFTARPSRTAAQPEKKAAAADDPSKPREADAAAIEKLARQFEKAFNAGDAKAIAANVTDNAELTEPGGRTVTGREAIEKAYAELFAEKEQEIIEVDVHSVRFPSKDTAIEEGFLRYTPTGPGLPSSTMYTASHVREGDTWKLAYSREFGAGQDRLGDLAFLIGDWQGSAKGLELSLQFQKDPKGPFILGRFTRKAEGKTAGGSLKIGIDKQRSQIRSWHFDDDGGHGECLWIRDGNNWTLDAIGVTSDGTETGAVNLLSRLSNDEITWRSIDRVVGGDALPNTVPVKLVRIVDKK